MVTSPSTRSLDGYPCRGERHWELSLAAIGGAAGIGASPRAAANPLERDHRVDDDHGRRYPKGVRPTELHLIDRAAITDDAAIMIATLQGLLARPDQGRSRGPAIYFDLPNGYRIWLDDLTERYGLPAYEAGDPWSLVDRFAARIGGYVLYRSNGPTINVATSVAAATGSIAVAEVEEETAIAHGLRLVADVRDSDDAWALREFKDRLRNDLVVEQKADPSVGVFTHQLRDYATMAGAFTFYDGNSEFRREVVAGLELDSRVLG